MSNKKFLTGECLFIYKRENLMKRLYSWDEPNFRNVFINCIKEGKVALADSDTVLGLFAAVTDEGVQALDAIKTRRDKPYLILIGKKEDWRRYAQVPNDQATLLLIEACWPGPLTLILPMRADMPDYVGSIHRTVAIRMPAHAELCAIADACGGVFSTSANKAGLPIPTVLEEVDNDIKQSVCCIGLSSESKKQEVLPSTILDCTGEGVRVIRPGAYPVDELEQFYGKPLSA